MNIKNINALEGISYKMVLQKTPYMEFFGTNASLPSISIPPIERPTPYTTIKEQGDHIVFSPFDITFKIDENMANYEEILNWMFEIGAPTEYSEYGNPRNLIGTEKNVLTSDITILLFSSKNNPIKKFTFTEAWPSNLGAIQVNVQEDNVVYLECSVTFEYDTFTLGTP